jgi:hypothetical protein
MHGTYRHVVDLEQTQQLSVSIPYLHYVPHENSHERKSRPQVKWHLHLEQLVLQSHVVLRLQANACAEDVGQSTSLLSKSIDDWSSWRSQRCLEHVAKNAENTVEVLEILGSDAIIGVCLPLDASHHLSDDNQINDQWGRKQRVLADVEETEFD